MRRRIARTCAGAISWFFGEPASIEGGTIAVVIPSQMSGMNASRENTAASALVT